MARGMVADQVGPQDEIEMRGAINLCALPHIGNRRC